MTTRRDRLLVEPSHDPTRPQQKLSDPTVCPDCGACFREGRWTWRPGPADAPRKLCSACQRIREGYPAGFVSIRGAFARARQEEIMRLVRNTEEREKGEHPINRILDVLDSEEELLIRTTEVHLARAIGSALHSAYQGNLDLQYDEDVVRVSWIREA